MLGISGMSAMASGTWLKVARTGDVPVGQVRVLEAGGERIALCRLPEGFYAVQDLCTHDDGPLGEGTLVDGQIQCPRHGARFDVKTGAVGRMPAIVPIRVYPVKVEGEDVLVQI